MRRAIPLIILVLAIYSTVTMAQGNRQAYLPIVYKPGVPTVTPTATTTPQTGEVVVLGNHSTYEHHYSPGSWFFVGEVQNNTSSMIDGLQFTVDLYHQEALVFAFTSDLQFSGYLAPDEKQCFAVYSGPDEQVPFFDSYVIHDPSYTVSTSPVVELVASSFEGDLRRITVYDVSGFAYNANLYAVTRANANIVLYDRDGVVLDCNWHGEVGAQTFQIDAEQGKEVQDSFSRRAEYASVDSFGVQIYGIPLDGPFTPTPTLTPSATPTGDLSQ